MYPQFQQQQLTQQRSQPQIEMNGIQHVVYHHQPVLKNPQPIITGLSTQGYSQSAPIIHYPNYVKIFKLVIGDITVTSMINIVTYLASITLIVTYIVCCSLGHEPWFPVMITSTGTHYPENIFFRIGLMTSIFYWGVIIWLEYLWLKAQSESLIGVVTVTAKSTISAYAGFFFFGLTIATIDQGGTPHIHGVFAVLFFLLLAYYSFSNFFILKKIIQYKPNVVSEESYSRKKTLIKVWYVVLFFIILLALGFKWGLPVAEWIGTFAIILYLNTYADDLKNFYLNVDDQKYDLKSQLAANTKKASDSTDGFETISTTASTPQVVHILPVYQGYQNVNAPIKTISDVDSSFMQINRPLFAQEHLHQ